MDKTWIPYWSGRYVIFGWPHKSSANLADASGFRLIFLESKFVLRSLFKSIGRVIIENEKRQNSLNPLILDPRSQPAGSYKIGAVIVNV